MTGSQIPKPYPVPDCEQERLTALYSYQILDSPPDASFDRIANLAATLFNAPIALLSLVDADRQWFKAKCGLAAGEAPRDFSFCTYAMLGSGPMVVRDALQDARFLRNPLVAGDLSIRFYAGAPIHSSHGLPLGTLCVLDKAARELPSPSLLQSLLDLAALASELIEFRSLKAAQPLAEKRHREELEMAAQRAHASNQAKNDFLAKMSHEIRTPMNLIMGMSTLLLDSPLNAKQRQHVEITHRNVRRLLRLINGILDLSKVEAGEMAFRCVPFDLHEVLNESAATIAAAVEGNGLTFEIAVEIGTWRYWIGDPERLQQVLLNLIANSIKFTPVGKIEVRVREEGVFKGQNGLRFEVSDSGCGVPKEKAMLIFEAFHQAYESTSRPYEGTGLGLSIAKTFVERMGGKIWLAEKAEPGANFVFTIFLPASTAEALQVGIEPPVPSQFSDVVAPGTRILLAEDNPENVVMMQAYLQTLPLLIDIAWNGLEAFEKRRRNRYDLVLMDIRMPVMDGYDATREIRLWEHQRQVERVPIVALTAHAFPGAAATSLEAGCDSHLTKPVERHELLTTIAKFARLTRDIEPLAASATDAAAEIPEEIRARQPAFLANRKADLENMRAALAAGNFALIQKVGHNCKGTGAGYGFPEVSRIGFAIETSARAADRDKVRESIDLLEECLQLASRAA